MRVDRTWYEQEAWSSADWPAAGSSFPTLGWVVADWIEQWLVHGPGVVSGDPVRLTDEQLVFLAHAYRLDEYTGRRVYTRCVLSRPKGWAKSEFAAWVTIAEALAPVRFSHWAEDGQPVGRVVQDPQIRLMATEVDQVGNTYDNVTAGLLEGPAAEAYGLKDRSDIQADRVVLPNGGEIKVSTSSARAKDGGKETFAVGDEIHLFILAALIQMIRTILRNMVKRAADTQPWALFTTTSYKPGENSLAEEYWDRAKKLSGSAPVTDQSTGFLFDHRQGGPLSEEEINGDPELVLAELAKAYGDAAWMVNEDVVREMRESTVSDANRYFLNADVAGDAAYMSMSKWDEAHSDERLKPGDFITLGFDGSRGDDSTALVACRVDDGLIQPLGIWNKDESDDYWRVDSEAVHLAVSQAFTDFNVARFYCDPPYWDGDVDTWVKTYGAKKVIEWYTSRRAPMFHALERLRVGIELSGELRHGGDPDLSRSLTLHVGNAIRVKNPLGYGIQKPKRTLKIDSAIAAVLAVEARGDVIAAGLRPKNYGVGSWS